MARTAQQARTAKQALHELSLSGPHEILRGDLGLVGTPGLVVTPRTGLSLPAIGFGHGWLQPPQRYARLFRHLASWGFVVVAPGTQRGPLPSHRLFAADLRTALDIATGVRLGDGRISVDPGKLGLAGHSMGGSAAVLAAAGDPRVRAVATLALGESFPSAIDYAAKCTMPGLHLAGGQDLIAPATGHAEPVAKAWAGPVRLRTLRKASHLGFAEGRHWSDLLLHGKEERGTGRLAKAMLTAFFLRELTGDTRFDALLDHAVSKVHLDLTVDDRPDPADRRRRRKAS